MNNKTFLCASLLLAAGPGLSAELDYVVRGGISYSDNIERLPSGFERDSSAAVVGLELRGSRPEGRLRYDVNADVSYNEYLDLDIGSEITGNAAARGAYDIVPDNFAWNASLAYDQVREDNFRPLAPGNSDDSLTFSTGPTLRARFSGVMEGQLDGRYTRTSYQERPFDNETVGGRATLGRRANPRSLLAVGASYDDVSYLSSSGPSGLDFKRKEAFVRMELEGVRTGIDVEVGYADANGELVDENGLMLRARLNRQISPFLSGFINAVREYPTSEEMSFGFDPTTSGGGEYDGSELTSGPRLSTSFGTGLRYDRTRVLSEVNYTYREEESLLALAGERKYHELSGRLTRRFTPGVRGSVIGALTREEFSGVSGKANERIVGAEVGIAFGPALGLDIRAEHRKRDGATAAGDYSELAGGIFLRYAGGFGRGGAE